MGVNIVLRPVLDIYGQTRLPAQMVIAEWLFQSSMVATPFMEFPSIF